MAQPQRFWKLSMGPGAYAEFKNLLLVLDWLRQGQVLVHRNTGPVGLSSETQGEKFVSPDRDGDYFYLCHGNEKPSILLLGRLKGPVETLTIGRRKGWASRRFDWIKTSTKSAKFTGVGKGWTPNHNSTFVEVPQNDLAKFEDRILVPFFELKLASLKGKSLTA